MLTVYLCFYVKYNLFLVNKFNVTSLIIFLINIKFNCLIHSDILKASKQPITVHLLFNLTNHCDFCWEIILSTNYQSNLSPSVRVSWKIKWKANKSKVYKVEQAITKSPALFVTKSRWPLICNKLKLWANFRVRNQTTFLLANKPKPTRICHHWLAFGCYINYWLLYIENLC